MQYDKLRDMVVKVQDSIVDDDGDAYGLCDRLIGTLNEMEKNNTILTRENKEALDFIIKKLTEIEKRLERK